MGNIKEILDGYTFRKDLAMDTMKDKSMECLVTVGDKERIKYIVIHYLKEVLVTENFNDAVAEYEKM